MSRVKLSEFKSKKILFKPLGLNYEGISVDLGSKTYRSDIDQLPGTKLYVAKVDQAVKKRGKGGLVALKRTKKQLPQDLQSFAKLGYRHALVEPYVEHAQAEEHYVALQRTEVGVELSYSVKGGVDVELNPSAIKRAILPENNYTKTANTTGLDNKFAQIIYELFQNTHMTLLEINPLVIKEDQYLPLDAAVEVDSAGQLFAGSTWDEGDFRTSKIKQNKAELVVEELNSKSPASFSLKVLNPNGSIFLLLSGGGASVVVADELANLTDYKKVANYGEYSGNPSEDETFAYTKEVLNLIINSSSKKKGLIIAGGVANFTDVHKTFAGIIRAMRLYAKDMNSHKVKVFVRRGGPNQEQGLKAIRNFLEEIGLNHRVYGPDKSLSEVVGETAKAVG